MCVRVAATLSLLLCVAVLRPQAFDARLPIVQVEAQPLAAQAARVAEALAYVGAPLSPADREALARGGCDGPTRPPRSRPSSIRYCLLEIHINPESRVKVAPGPARAELVERGWRTFLVKVRNEAGVTAPLRVSSPQARPRVRARRARLQHGSAAGADDLGRRRRRSLARPGAVRQAAAGRRRSPAWTSSTASSSSTSATPASARRRSPPTSARARRTSASATTRRSSSPSGRRST